jgi:hypothetical protein
MAMLVFSRAILLMSVRTDFFYNLALFGKISHLDPVRLKSIFGPFSRRRDLWRRGNTSGAIGHGAEVEDPK